MKILMQARANLLTLRGGDTIQILKTKEYLEKMGLDITLSTDLNEDISEYDIIHLFNLTRVQETYLQAKKAKELNKIILLSTIYWPTDELELKGQLPLRRLINNIIGVDNFEKLKIILKYFKGENDIPLNKILSKSFKGMQKDIILFSDWLLPNSKIEILELQRQFDIDIKNYDVVVNAIDSINNNSVSNLDDEYKKYKGSIICIGRIEPRKNQLNLVRALYNSNYKLYIIGKPAPNHIKYYENVKKEANKNTVFVDYMNNEEIYKVCSEAEVHVLPSWYETPGLVSLEAGVCGCKVVVSDKGTTRDYFGELVEYCEPGNINSILKAVEKSYEKNKDDKLKTHIKSNFTWVKAAEQTYNAYKKVYKSKLENCGE